MKKGSLIYGGLMKIKKLILENFRCYKNRTVLDIDDLTGIIGENDAGKSTILDAFELFFNDGKGIVKIDPDDLNKYAESENIKEVLIGVVFTDLPSEIIIDATVSISLKDEFLLNEDGDLEIHKIFVNGKLKSTNILAKHPVNDDFIKNLLLKPISELRNFVDQEKLHCNDRRTASILRKCIRESYKNLEFDNIYIPIDKEGMRDIWSKINQYMPIYALFKSDRTNTEDNVEIQNPLKIIVKQILQKPEIQEKLSEIAEEVRIATMEMAHATLNELKKINPEVAKELKPNIPNITKLKWVDVFKKIGIISDNNVPLNKRGSGVRRLVLLSFFSAEVNRRKTYNDNVTVVYAIEEPETSQHPEHQKLLINNFIELSKTENSQVILTTHSSHIAQLLPPESLRFIKKLNNVSTVQSGKDNDNILFEIVDSLGILPTFTKLIICVEGERDRIFLLNINKNIPELKEIVDLSRESISIIPLHGSNLKQWVDRNYLKDSGVIEFHLYDKDEDEKYKEEIEKVQLQPNSFGLLTKKREIENYIHKSLVETEFNITIDSQIDWDNQDIPEYIAKKTGRKKDQVKDILCGKLSKKMTKDLFEDLNAWEEVKNWFEQIRDYLNRTIRATDSNS